MLVHTTVMAGTSEKYTPKYEHINVSNIAIMLPSAAEIDARLDSENIYSLILLTHDDAAHFPQHIESINLEALQSADELPAVTGSVDISRQVIKNCVGAWPNGLLENMRGEISNHGYKIKRNKTDAREFYVQLDDYCDVRVSLIVEHLTFRIKVELVESDKDSVSGDQISTGEAAIETTEILTIGIQSALQIFSDKKQKPKDIIIDATQPIAMEVFNNPSPPDVRFMGDKAVQLVNMEHPSSNNLLDRVKPDQFDSIGGAYTPKQALRKLAETFLHPEVASLYGIRPSHFILHGPSGTGKTSLVRAYANMIGAEFEEVPSTKIIEKWVGGSAKQLQEIFDNAYLSTSPIVLFFDEIDGWAADNGTQSGETLQALRVFQQQFNRRLAENPHVIIAAATNCDIDDLPPALVRSGRLNPIDVPLPTEKERCDIWMTLLNEYHIDLEIAGRERDDSKPFNPVSDLSTVGSYDFTTLSQLTTDRTGSDIRQMIDSALAVCLEKHLASGEVQPLTQEILVAVIKQFYR